MKKYLINIIPLLFILAGFLCIYSAVIGNRKQGKVNNSYVRVINCIISKNAASRTQTDIEICYRIVERENNVKLIRYDQFKE